MSIFETISDCHTQKDIRSICGKLAKSFSFDSGKDAELLCKLAYLLYVLEDFENVKAVSQLTHNVPFPGRGYFRVWDFVLFIWGLEAYLLQNEGSDDMARERIAAIEAIYEIPLPDMYKSMELQRNAEKNRRQNCKYVDVLRKREIANATSVRSANNWRLIALYKMIGYTYTGLYPDLVSHRHEIENAVEEYLQELRLHFRKA